MLQRITLKDIATRFGVSRRAAQRWAQVYAWPCVKLGRLRLYDIVEVEAHMKTLGFHRAQRGAK